jgi:hypothetical protein
VGPPVALGSGDYSTTELTSTASATLTYVESALECLLTALSLIVMDIPIAGSLTPFSEATRVERLDSHTYRVNLVDSFCIGTGKHDLK